MQEVLHGFEPSGDDRFLDGRVRYFPEPEVDQAFRHVEMPHDVRGGYPFQGVCVDERERALHKGPWSL